METGFFDPAAAALNPKKDENDEKKAASQGLTYDDIFLRKKNKVVTGTYYESAFQLSLSGKNDPLFIHLFDVLG